MVPTAFPARTITPRLQAREVQAWEAKGGVDEVR
jgi:hypothetical protein